MSKNHFSANKTEVPIERATTPTPQKPRFKFSLFFKIKLFFVIGALSIAVILASHYAGGFHPLYVKVYDWRHWQSPVTSIEQIDAVLAQFDTIRFEDLDAHYLHYSQSLKDPFKGYYEGKTYYKIQGDDMYQYIVGRYRIKDFLAKDKYYKIPLWTIFGNLHQYLLLDKKILYNLLELQKELDKQGYDPDGFCIESGFRHPHKNKLVGGASKSRHLHGDAIDISIGDINKDGKKNKKDKKIVLDILDKTVIKNEGGIGRYPNSMSIHFDVRGKRARWDKF